MNSAEHVSGTGHANGTGGADQSFWRGMLGLILPRGCAGCDKPDDVLCDDCHALFRRHLAMPLYGTMQSGAAQGETRQETMIRREVSGDWQADASRRSDAWQPAMPQSDIPQCLIHAAGLYQGNVRRAILSWKDHGDAECDKSFAHVCRELVAGSGLVETLKTADPSAGLSASGLLASGSLATGSPVVGSSAAGSRRGSAPSPASATVPRTKRRHTDIPPHTQILVIPAPSSSKSMRARGRRHLWPLAKATAAELAAAGVEACAVNALRTGHVRGKAVETHNALGRAARLDGQLEMTDPGLVAGRRVLILDDIVTTGTTMRRCAEAIRGARGNVVGGLALAAVPPPSNDEP